MVFRESLFETKVNTWTREIEENVSEGLSVGTNGQKK